MNNQTPFPIQASTNYKEAFALFDKRGNGRVALQSLGDLLRACGQNPTLAEIHELEKGVGGDCTYDPCMHVAGTPIPSFLSFFVCSTIIIIVKDKGGGGGGRISGDGMT